MKSYIDFVNDRAVDGALITDQGKPRSDGGEDITMKHENIITGPLKGKIPMEKSSLQLADEASQAVQKTPNRVSLQSMEAKIRDIEYIHPETIPHMTLCVITVANGFALVGWSAPADPENFDQNLGRKFAYEDAIRKLWPYEAYLLREEMMRANDAV